MTEIEDDIIKEDSRGKQQGVIVCVGSHLLEAFIACLCDRVHVVEHVEEAPADLEWHAIQCIVPHQFCILINLCDQPVFTHSEIFRSQAPRPIESASCETD